MRGSPAQGTLVLTQLLRTFELIVFLHGVFGWNFDDHLINTNMIGGGTAVPHRLITL